jgi:hypothetical protein
MTKRSSSESRDSTPPQTPSPKKAKSSARLIQPIVTEEDLAVEGWTPSKRQVIMDKVIAAGVSALKAPALAAELFGL